MSNEKNEQVRKAYICFLDENNFKRDGYVEVLKMNQSFITFKTNSNNIITISIARLLKLKEKGEGDGNNS